MIIHVLISILFLLQTPSPFLVFALNDSYIIHSSSSSSPDEETPDESASGLGFPERLYPPRPVDFIEDVLRKISVKQKWDLNEIRVPKLTKARFARLQSYEFRVRIQKTSLTFRFSEEVDSWTRLGEDGDLKHLINQASSKAELTPFEVEGPVELISLWEDRMSLQLPKNGSLSGLKRILIHRGITLQITRAREISLFHGSCSGTANTSSKGKPETTNLWTLRNPFCTSFLPIHVLGPALLIPYKRTEHSNFPFEAKFLSKDIVELTPAKCYTNHMHRTISCPINPLSTRISTMETFLKRLLDTSAQSLNHTASVSLKTDVKASTMIQFRLELEREARNGDYLGSDKKVEEWRTTPNVERAWFDVIARKDGNSEKLHVIEVKSVRPFISVDSAAWSNVLLNVSFTQFPGLLVPSRPLTLDVKW